MIIQFDLNDKTDVAKVVDLIAHFHGTPKSSAPAATPKAAAPAAKPAVAAKPAAKPVAKPAPKDADPEDAEGITYENDVKPLILALGKAGKRDAIATVLAEFGVEKGPELTEDQWEEARDRFQAELDA